MAILSSARVPAIRAKLERLLAHTCTVTPRVEGSPDSENNATVTDGTPQTGVRCTFATVSRAQRDEGGTTLVTVPTLLVSATLSLPIGSTVSAIKDTTGATPPGAAGTFRVERVLDDTAGLGAALLPTYELRGAGVV
jgi:hypothetical protein